MPPEHLDPFAELAAYWRPIVDATLAQPQPQQPMPAPHAHHASAGAPGAVHPLRMSPERHQALTRALASMAAERPQVDTDALDASYAKEQADTGPRYQLNPFGAP